MGMADGKRIETKGETQNTTGDAMKTSSSWTGRALVCAFTFALVLDLTKTLPDKERLGAAILAMLLAMLLYRFVLDMLLALLAYVLKLSVIVALIAIVACWVDPSATASYMSSFHQSVAAYQQLGPKCHIVCIGLETQERYRGNMANACLTDFVNSCSGCPLCIDMVRAALAKERQNLLVGMNVKVIKELRFQGDVDPLQQGDSGTVVRVGQSYDDFVAEVRVGPLRGRKGFRFDAGLGEIEPDLSRPAAAAPPASGVETVRELKTRTFRRTTLPDGTVIEEGTETSLKESIGSFFQVLGNALEVAR